MFIKMMIKFIFVASFFILSACVEKKPSHPVVGKWSTEKSCQHSLTLTQNHQISGKNVIGTWEARKDFLELNIAQKKGAKFEFVQVLTTKPSGQKMRILQIVYPEHDFPWPQKINDTLHKCS